MKALRYELSPLKFVACQAVKRVWPSVFLGSLGCLKYRDDVPEPTLPGPDWVKLHTVLGGICGSDLNGIFGKHRFDSVYSRFVSYPFGMGHENVSRIAELGPEATGFEVGQRVVVDPMLPCVARGIDPPCRSCAAGNPSTCLNFRAGELPPGTSIGNNSRTGGSWGQVFVAHRSQLQAVDEALSDEQALLLDPFSSAVHGVCRAGLPARDHRVVVLGAGCMGLCTIAALRGMGFKGKLVVTARYDFQAELARRFGADEVLRKRGRELVRQLADVLGGEYLIAAFGDNQTVIGGAETVFDTISSKETMGTALKCAGPDATVMMMGHGYPRKFDASQIWLKQLRLLGALSTGAEDYDGRRVDSYDIAHELVRTGKVDLSPMLTHRYPLEDYRRAFLDVMNRRESKQVKSTFVLDPRHK